MVVTGYMSVQGTSYSIAHSSSRFSSTTYRTWSWVSFYCVRILCYVRANATKLVISSYIYEVQWDCPSFPSTTSEELARNSRLVRLACSEYFFAKPTKGDVPCIAPRVLAVPLRDLHPLIISLTRSQRSSLPCRTYVCAHRLHSLNSSRPRPRIWRHQRRRSLRLHRRDGDTTLGRRRHI